jgi:predicted metal-dependent phosphoesterase TrpH
MTKDMTNTDLIRVDFHAHTHFSFDAWQSPAEAVERAVEAGLDRIAITDHDAIDGALDAHARYPEHVIVGEEISCACRTHLIGLFLREHIPAGLEIEETADRIRAQGGVVYAPHPTAYPTGKARRLERLMAVADVVEVVNGRAFVPAWNRSARLEAERRGLPALAGTDGHFSPEIGRVYTEMPRFRGASDFLAAARHARAIGASRGVLPLVCASAALEIVTRLGMRPASRRVGALLPAGAVGRAA